MINFKVIHVHDGSAWIENNGISQVVPVETLRCQREVNNLKADGVKLVNDALKESLRDMNRNFLSRVAKSSNIEICNKLILALDELEKGLRNDQLLR